MYIGCLEERFIVKTIEKWSIFLIWWRRLILLIIRVFTWPIITTIRAWIRIVKFAILIAVEFFIGFCSGICIAWIFIFILPGCISWLLLRVSWSFWLYCFIIIFSFYFVGKGFICFYNKFEFLLFKKIVKECDNL